MSINLRAAAAVVLALLGPFPGPHVNRYLPLAAVVFGGVSEGAGPVFFALAAAIASVYALAAFGILLAAEKLVTRRRTSRERSG